MELYQYHDLLRIANDSEDQYVRLLYVTIFSITNFSNSRRMAKPFNPLLGETYEYYDDLHNLKFLSEQTSHHPPISSAYLETDYCIVELDVIADSRVGFNGIQLPIEQPFVVTLKKTGEIYYTHRLFTTYVHNLILGSMWLEHSGKWTINVVGSEISSEIELKKCGFFSQGWNEIEGSISDDGSPVYEIKGKWTENITVTRKRKTNLSGDKLFDRKPTVAWEPQPKVAVERFSKWYLDEWVEKLIVIDDEMKLHLLETDSRLREDRILLERGLTVEAGNEKSRLENEQRERRKKLELEGGVYTPRFFEESEFEGMRIFRYNHGYDTELEQKLELTREMKNET